MSFRVLNRMRDERTVAQYAVGGATAVLFYADRERLRRLLTTHAVAVEIPNDA